MKINNQGIVEGVRFIRSPNQGGKITPKFVTIHYTAGWTTENAIATLTSPAAKVSAQFVIGRDGEIVQLVSCENRAWHAGPSKFMGYNDMNSHSIGIELVNPGYFRIQSDGSLRDWNNKPIPAERLKGYDVSVRSAHPRIGGGKLAWPAYTPAQLKALDELLEAITNKYDIIAANSHEEIDTRGWKTDPGYAFPIGEYKAKVDRFEGRASNGVKPTTGVRVDAEVANKGGLNLRADASNNAAVLMVLKAGQDVKIIKDTGEWSQVSVVGTDRTGWVADKYLRYI